MLRVCTSNSALVKFSTDCVKNLNVNLTIKESGYLLKFIFIFISSLFQLNSIVEEVKYSDGHFWLPRLPTPRKEVYYKTRHEVKYFLFFFFFFFFFYIKEKNRDTSSGKGNIIWQKFNKTCIVWYAK